MKKISKISNILIIIILIGDIIGNLNYLKAYRNNNIRYPPHFNIKPVLHYVGEEKNERFPNSPQASAWNKNWIEGMGGVDLPDIRNRSHLKPTHFIPKENIFYCALPYNDLDNWGRKVSSHNIPWATDQDKQDESIMRGRWVRVVTGDVEGYCQLADVGPFESDDFDYVFGPSHSVPEYDHGGIGISPALAQLLGLLENIKERDTCTWSFIEEDQVPIGPWKFQPVKEERLLKSRKKVT